MSHAEASSIQTREIETKAQNALLKRLKKEERKRAEALKLDEENLLQSDSDGEEESRTNHFLTSKSKQYSYQTNKESNRKKRKKKRKRR